VDIGLCMIVKNEEDQMLGCLQDIAALFSDISIVDTGSTDNTVSIIENGLGIVVRDYNYQAKDESKYHARNFGLSQLDTPWVFSIDADERLSREHLLSLMAMPDPQHVDGFFIPWNTHREGSLIEDYKLSLFRRGTRSMGRLHENYQVSLRMNSGHAEWLGAVELTHFPDARKTDDKLIRYTQTLHDAIEQEPDWYRYHWFLGYTCYMCGKQEEAGHFLGTAAQSCSRQFPVECLNSHMLLAEIQAGRGCIAEAGETIHHACEFYETVKDDFEVRVNTRLKPWLDAARQYLDDKQPERIKAYLFSY